MTRTLTETWHDVVNHVTTPDALVQQSLEAVRSLSEFNAIAYSNATEAQSTARERTAEVRAGKVCGPLHGIPVTIKDLYNVNGLPTRGGTRAQLPDLGGEAVAVSRLKAAGAIVLAKTNLHEIAAGVSGENIWTGDVKNPHDPARQAGGSSGGSAVSVATGMVAASLGSDTAGSIRVPAAFCGVVGFKPTFGLIPLDGALALCWSCDHAGPLTRTVDDARVMTEVLAARALALRLSAEAAPTRLGVPRRFLEGWLGSGVRRAFEALLTDLAAAGVTLVDVDAPIMAEALDIYAPMRAAESAYVHRVALAREPEHFSPAVLDRLQAGRDMPAMAYFETQHRRAQMAAEIAAMLSEVDALVLPTSPLPAPLRGSSEVELERGRTEHRAAFVRLTLPFSFVGVPALALPFGAEGGMPISVQLVGPRHADARVLEVGYWLESFIKQRA
jgi:aspartyl-tRNA(Asn)/glutamyl-tRNA(Gln) amidotransferase subunit A